MRRLRVEDVLCALIAAILLVYIGAARALGAYRVAGSDTWTVSFVMLPMSIIIFLASLRYALGRDGTTFGRWAGEVTEVARDWLPFLLFLLFYVTFHSSIWMTIQPASFDARLLAIDRRLLGETPSVAMQSWYSPALTSFMSLCYFLHLIFPPVVAGLWYRRDKRMFRELLLAVLFCGALGTMGYLAVPAVGPGIAFPQLYTRTFAGSLYHPIIDLMDIARAPRDVFPSLHVAISAIVLWYAWPRSRALFALLAPFVIGNWISTIYLRYHYAVDDVAGIVTAAAAIALAALALRAESALKRDTPPRTQPAPPSS